MRKLGGFRLKKLFNWNLSIPMRRVVGGRGDRREARIDKYVQSRVIYVIRGQTKWIINWMEIFGAGGRLIECRNETISLCSYEFTRWRRFFPVPSDSFNFQSVIQPINTCFGWKLHDSQLVRFVRFRLNSGNLVETNLSSLRRFGRCTWKGSRRK